MSEMLHITRLPNVAALELTYRCNHRCLFCSCPWESDETYRKDELKTEQWFAVIDELMKNGVSAFTLTGGEPLMREDLIRIIEYILQKGASLNMISNGRKIDDEFLDYIAKKKISICISIPGIETFVEHTGVDNVEHVLSLFEKTKIRGIQATANIAVTKKNLPELYENIAYALIKGADYVLLNRFLPGGRGLQNQEYLLTKKETNRMLDIAETVLAKANKYGHVGTELPLCAIDHPERYKHIQVSNLCSAAKAFALLIRVVILRCVTILLSAYVDMMSLKHWNKTNIGCSSEIGIIFPKCVKIAIRNPSATVDAAKQLMCFMATLMITIRSSIRSLNFNAELYPQISISASL